MVTSYMRYHNDMEDWDYPEEDMDINIEEVCQ